MGRYRSLQSIMLAEALKGITDNQTITAYKKDCKLFAAYCKEQGVKRPDQLQGKEKELLQGYEKQLEASGYSPATIHRRLEKMYKVISKESRSGISRIGKPYCFEYLIVNFSGKPARIQLPKDKDMEFE